MSTGMGPSMNINMSTSMPCAACKLLRRRCTERCIFLPYFPACESDNFAVVHQVFGASNFSKLLNKIPKESREDAVTSMVYEARARVKDPVYGSVGLIASLQTQVLQLNAQLDEAIAEATLLRAQLSHCHSPSTTSQPSRDYNDIQLHTDFDFDFPVNDLVFQER